MNCGKCMLCSAILLAGLLLDKKAAAQHSYYPRAYHISTSGNDNGY